MAEVQARLAVLIDAENVPRTILPGLMQEVGKNGRATVKRAYANWASANFSSWKEDLHKFGFQPVQIFSCVAGKNAADAALIIDAMDLLHAGHLQGFCIVSTDSDFTRLCSRIREAGLIVYVYGKSDASNALRAACDKFRTIEDLIVKTKPLASSKTAAAASKGATPSPAPKTAPTTEPCQRPLSKKVVDLLAKAIGETRGNDGWVFVSTLHQHVLKTYKEFKPKQYGHSSLIKMLENSEHFEVERRATNHPYVRVKSG